VSFSCRTVCVLLGLALLALAGCGGHGDRPNLVLISIDTLRADHLTPYGYARDTTPFLMELARESVLFEDAIAQCGTTPQSLASLMTGLYPYTDRLVERDGRVWYLDQRFHTLAQVLTGWGFRTHAITSQIQAARITGLDKGFETFDGIELTSDDSNPVRDAAEMTQLAGEWLKSAGESGSPFFLWLHYLDPHHPYRAPAFRDAFADEVPVEPESAEPRYYVYGPKKSKRYPLTDAELGALILEYDREVRYVDEALRTLFEGELAPYLDESIVVLTADHGEALGDHGMITHNELYHSILRVPLLIRLPGARGGGRTVSSPVMLVDVFPTVLELIGLRRTSPLRGISLTRHLEGGSDHDARIRLAEYGEKAIYQDRFVLIQRDSGRELYDVDADPRETRNLSATMLDYQDGLVDEVASWKWIEPDTRSAVRRPLPTVTSRELEALEALGYVEE
jgi:arylsulfatase A-like enzyme